MVQNAEVEEGERDPVVLRERILQLDREVRRFPVPRGAREEVRPTESAGCQAVPRRAFHIGLPSTAGSFRSQPRWCALAGKLGSAAEQAAGGACL